MFREALVYPFAGERPGRRLLGTFVIIASLVLLVTVPIYVGYLVRLLREAAYGEDAPPRNGDVGGLFVNGLTALGLVAVYAALPLAPFVVVSLPFVDVTLGTPGQVALAVVSLALAYLVPAVLASYAVDANVVGGLAVRRIARALRSPGYLRAWITAVVVVAPALAVVGVLALFGPLPVLLIGPAVVLYGTVVGGAVVGWGFAGAVDMPRRPVRREYGRAG